MNNLKIKALHWITFPIELIGWCWYMFVETPLFRGRMHGHDKMASLYEEASHEEE